MGRPYWRVLLLLLLLNAGAPPPLHDRVACGMRDSICTCVLAVAGRPRASRYSHVAVVHRPFPATIILTVLQ
eukprot:6435371-Prymnesium_polylepis.1